MDQITQFPIEMMRTPEGYELRHNKKSWIFKKLIDQTQAAFFDLVNKKAFELAVELDATAVCETKWYQEDNLVVVT